MTLQKLFVVGFEQLDMQYVSPHTLATPSSPHAAMAYCRRRGRIAPPAGAASQQPFRRAQTSAQPLAAAAAGAPDASIALSVEPDGKTVSVDISVS